MTKKRILIIEDDRDISRTLELHLTSLGYETIASFDGKEGADLVRDLSPDLLILDLGLPHLPGEEICRELRRSQKYQTLPIIMVTAKDTDVDRVIGRVIGADFYVSKPFDLDDLEKKIRLLINRRLFPSAETQAAITIVETEKEEFSGRAFVKGNIPEINNSLCTGCSLCVKKCNKIGANALEIKERKAAVSRPKQCLGCGACIVVCPSKAIFLLSHPNI